MSKYITPLVICIGALGVGILFLIISNPTPTSRQYFYDFNAPEGIAVDTQNNVYLADTGNHRVIKFDPQGTFLLQIGAASGSLVGQFNLPSGVAVNKQGEIYVADRGNDRIQKFDSSGRVMGTIGSFGTKDGQFSSPSAIALDPDGNFYVADKGNSRVQKFDPSGRMLLKWGNPGTRDGQFFQPSGLGVDSKKNVYVLDGTLSTTRIQKFDSSGNYLARYGNFTSASGLAFDSTDFGYIVDYTANRVRKFNDKNSLVLDFTCCRDNDAYKNLDSRIVVDGNKDYYLGDFTYSQVLKYNAAGQLVSTWVYPEVDDWSGIAIICFVVAGIALLFLLGKWQAAVKERKLRARQSSIPKNQKQN